MLVDFHCALSVVWFFFLQASANVSSMGHFYPDVDYERSNLRSANTASVINLIREQMVLQFAANWPITGCTVAPHGYNGDVSFLWAKLEF